MAAKTKRSISHKGESNRPHSPEKPVRINEAAVQYAIRRTRDGSLLPPPGPSNIIIRTPNPLPPPRNVESQ